MSNRAFVYKAFVVNPVARKTIKNLDSVLIDFYAQKAQPQHLVWSTSKMVQLRCVGSEGWRNNTLINYKLQGIRGEEKKVVGFSCADLPLMNPYDWIKIHTILLKRKDDSYKNYLNHVGLMLKSYITEVAKEDFEIADKFQRTVKAPNDTSENIKNVRDGTILTDPWAVIYKTHEDQEYKTKIFYLNEKHLYSTSNLNTFMAKVELNPNNSPADKKHIYDTIKWWLAGRKQQYEHNPSNPFNYTDSQVACQIRREISLIEGDWGAEYRCLAPVFILVGEEPVYSIIDFIMSSSSMKLDNQTLFNLANSIGSSSKVPTLFTEDYEIWALHMEDYLLGLENGYLIWKSVSKGSHSFPLTDESDDISIQTKEQYEVLKSTPGISISKENKKRIEIDLKAK
ncbi:hypothetical protein LXL04_008977 [Taraxacum kok-saghyz]